MRRPKSPVRLGAPLLLTEAEGRLVLAERKIRVFSLVRSETTALMGCPAGVRNRTPPPDSSPRSRRPR
jgi:hypothetical protein